MKGKITLKILSLLFCCLAGRVITAKGQTTLYVDANMGPSGTGLSWASPYQSLKTALEFANITPAVTTIYVAKGEYRPTTGTVRDSAFVIRRGGLKIYGGYQPGGTGVRNTALYPSVMTGDIGVNNNNSDNCYHVLVIAGLPLNADSIIVDGFTVRDGNANSSGSFTCNGQSLPRTEGGGISQYGNASGSKTVIRNCLVTKNNATSGGGTEYVNCYTATGIVQNCVFAVNTATNGAAIYNYYSQPFTINSVFYGNTGGNNVFVNQTGTPLSLTNCTFNGNTAPYTVAGDSVTPINCVLWGDIGTEKAFGYGSYSSHTIIQGTSSAQVFANAASPAGPDGILGTADDGLRLHPFCFGIDDGINDYIPSGITTDVTGATRFQNSIVDVGAYEGAGTATCSSPYTRLYVNAAVTASGSGGSWSTAYKTLQEALNAAYGCTAINEIWVEKGTYYPTAYPVGSVGGITARDYAFALRRGLAVYGGFAGGETTLAQRSVTANPTILSGDIGTAGDSTDNCYHVVISSRDDSTTLLDGFAIKGANANGYTNMAVNSFFPSIQGISGGGIVLMSTNAVVKNCTVSGNIGGSIASNTGAGGIYCFTDNEDYGYGYYPKYTPHLYNCLISDNTSLSNGGGLYIIGYNIPKISGCTFYHNTAGASGGGIYTAVYTSDTVQLANCNFLYNTAMGFGGAVAGGGGVFVTSAVNCTNSIFAYNKAQGNGGGLYIGGAHSMLTNCVFTADSAASSPGCSGGAIYADGLQMTGCTIAGNYASGPYGAISNIGNGNSFYSSSFINTIIWGNKSGSYAPAPPNSGSFNNYSFPYLLSISNGYINHCILQDWVAPDINSSYNNPLNQNSSYGYGYSTFPFQQNYRYNQDRNPLFVNSKNPAGPDGLWGTADDGLHVVKGSSAIDTGSNADVPAYITTDITGAPRIQNNLVDIGAYEGAGTGAASGTTLYVDSSVINMNTLDGTSWGSAYKTLQDALTVAFTCSNVTQIWVKKGVYTPSATPVANLYSFTYPKPSFGYATADCAFQLRNNLAVYGGFAGGETSLSQRNITANPTILNGLVNIDPVIAAAYNHAAGYNRVSHVVVALGSDSIARLDGFIVKNGGGNPYTTGSISLVDSANNQLQGFSFPQYCGGGIAIVHAMPAIANCTFSRNTAGSNPSLENDGGGMYAVSSSPLLSNCAFYNDSVAEGKGGGIYSNGSYTPHSTTGIFYDPGLRLFNCVIANNSCAVSATTSDGGGAYITGGSVYIAGSTIWGNSAKNDGGLFLAGVAPAFTAAPGTLIKNSIVWGNTATTNPAFNPGMAISNSDIQASAVYYNPPSPNSNTSFNPLFINPAAPAGPDSLFGTADDGLRLITTSPAMDGGYNPAVPASVTTDMLGTARIQNTTVDLGAYEGSLCSLSDTLRVDSSINFNTAGNGRSWATAIKDLPTALTIAAQCSGVTTINVAQGTYLPTVSTGSRDSAFTFLRGGLKVYGGYPTGGGTRNTTTYPTILSGDIGTTGTATDNSYHVVVVAGLTGATAADSLVLDGLTVTGGYAYGSGSKAYAGATLNQNEGAGIYLHSNSTAAGRIALRNCTVTGNTAGTYGGGIYTQLSSPVVANCLVNKNTCANGGAGMFCYNGASPQITGTVFSGNSVASGAAGYGGGLYAWNSSSPSVTACSFLLNKAFYGGGAALNGSSATLTACRFSNDTSGWSGGGLYSTGSASPAITSCAFSNNYAGYWGGGGFDNEQSSAATLANCVFTGNAGYFGGAVCNDGGATMSVTGNTVFGNAGYNGGGGGGLYNNASTMTVKNTVSWGNTGSAAIWSGSGGGTIAVTNSNVQGGYTGIGNSSADPFFTNSASPAGPDGILGTTDDGLQLAYCSPAINTGNNTGVTATDLTGATRIKFTNVDMGAYEKQTAAPANIADQAALSPASANVLPFVRGCDDGTWTYYAIPGNQDSIGFAVAWGANTAAKATATISIKVDAANTAATNPVAGTWAMRRYWNVDLGGQTLSTPVKVRFYYANADAQALLSAATASNLTPVSSIKWFKTVGNAYTPSQVAPANINNGAFILLKQAAFGVENNTSWVQFDSVVSFSGGTAMVNAGASSALPVTLVDFGAQKSPDGRSALLSWDVAGEHGITTYGVQRSTDGVSFQAIGTVAAAGKSSYGFTDASPATGTNYYRLAMVDQDGSYTYSYVRQLEFTATGGVAVAPNPTRGAVIITNANEALNSTEAVILDVSGRVVSRFTLQPIQAIQLADWAAGIYLLRLANGEVIKIEKQ